MPSPDRKILLVDDEERLLAGLRRRLSRDFAVETATSGEAALALIDADRAIAVVCADMQMPGMNGVALLKAVETKNPAIRRLMLTGNADLDTAMAAINEGHVDRFLRKPCDTEVLAEAFSRALEEHAFHASAQTPLSPAPEPDRGERARAAFLSMMNHELRTPLNQIIGLAGLLKAGAGGLDDAAALDHLRQIQSSGWRMLELVSRILEFSRLRSADAAEAQDVADVVEILGEEIERAREEASRMGVAIGLDSLRRHARTVGSAAEIRLALRELLSNAVKFSAVEGHVSVLVKTDPEAISVRIIDAGIGVTTDGAQRLLQPFRQIDESYARRSEGIGLGLALVSTIAQLNRIAFALEPGPRCGAQATLVFRRADARTIEAGPELSPPRAVAG